MLDAPGGQARRESPRARTTWGVGMEREPKGRCRTADVYSGSRRAPPAEVSYVRLASCAPRIGPGHIGLVLPTAGTSGECRCDLMAVPAVLDKDPATAG